MPIAREGSAYAAPFARRDDLGRHTGSFFGKLRSNFIGTGASRLASCLLALLERCRLAVAEFTLYDKGINPEKLEKGQAESSQVRQEMGTILYKQNVLGSRGPRKMKVMVPSINENGQRKVLRPTSKDETMLERCASGTLPCPTIYMPTHDLDTCGFAHLNCVRELCCSGIRQRRTMRMCRS